jgi:hypothetical protein
MEKNDQVQKGGWQPGDKSSRNDWAQESQDDGKSDQGSRGLPHRGHGLVFVEEGV